jgi:hypothetical protein
MYNKVACSPFVSVKINGLGNFLEQSKFYTLTAFGRLKSCAGECHFSHTCILSETSGKSIGVRTSYDMENSDKALIANDANIFKILTLGLVRN